MRLLAVGLVADGAGDHLAYSVDKGSGATSTLTAADGIVEIAADTNYVDAGDPVSVELFSPQVRPPRVLAVGEDDPAFSRVLDAVENPRYLAHGSASGRRSLRDGIADVAVLAGPDADSVTELDAEGSADGDLDAVEIGSWDRDWGLVVPPGNPDEIDGLDALVDRDLSFANRDGDSGIRARIDAAIDALAADRDTTRDELTDAISGYELETRGHASPAHRVADGVVDAGLGLRATAAELDLGFVELGTDTVRVVAAPGRRDKPGVADLQSALEPVD